MATNTTTPQTQLAAHLEHMHRALTSICMERWMQLAKGEFDPQKIQQITDVLTDLQNRMTYAYNCCYWIKQSIEPQDGTTTATTPLPPISAS